MMHTILYIHTVRVRNTSRLCWLTWTASTGLLSVSTDQREMSACASSGKTQPPPLVYFETHNMWQQTLTGTHNLLFYYKMFHCIFCFSLSLSLFSDLPWYKVFYRALDKISEFKLSMQVHWLYCTHFTINRHLHLYIHVTMHDVYRVPVFDHKLKRLLSQFKTWKATTLQFIFPQNH